MVGRHRRRSGDYPSEGQGSGLSHADFSRQIADPRYQIGMQADIVSRNEGRRTPRAISASWALEPIVGLGPEFLHWITSRASVVRRQAVFAVAAKGWLAEPEGIVAQVAPDLLPDAKGELARLLMIGDLPPIIAAAFGTCPDGYLSGLNRLGRDAFSEPELHLEFHRLYTDRALRDRRRVGQHLGRLTEDRLRMLIELDDALVHRSVLRRDLPIERMRDINAALQAVRSASTPDDEESLLSALHESGQQREIDDLLRTWIRRCRFPALPFAADEDAGVFPIQDAVDLMSRSLTYRNCTRSVHRAVDVICGRAAYVAYEPAGVPTAMAMLMPLNTGGWVVEGIYGVGNGHLSADQKAPLKAWLASRGVASVSRPAIPDTWSAALKLSGRRGWLELEDDMDV